tara:strand:- start:222 stop:536 length:315 start_codon:yes stop_codon:yes gene_type:complete
MADNGLKRYSVQEANNVTLGQLGFDVLTASSANTSGGPWIAIKALGDDNTLLALSSIGDSLSADGTSTGGSITISAGDIVYGAFTSITPGAYTTANDTVIAYRG